MREKDSLPRRRRRLNGFQVLKRGIEKIIKDSNSIYYCLLIFLTSRDFPSYLTISGTRIERDFYFNFLNHTFKLIQHSFNISPDNTISL